MAAYSPTPAMDELAQLFKRQTNCVKCPDQPPSCKTHVCEAGLTCLLQVQSCDSCAEVVCQKLTKTQTSAPADTANNGKGGAPVGAIVGGVFGFLIIVCVAAFFLIRRSKRKQKEAYEASVAAWAVEKDGSSYSGLRDARASTHSVGSIASTVLTRASNVIQIAYIPGVTNRSNPNSPGLLGVPPVPTIPGQHVPQGSGDHFFSANDIARQSVWSTNSGYTVASADPRASVATTIYRSNAIVSPLAATATVVRAKAVAVNVKTSPAISGASTPQYASGAPPVPSLDLSKFPAPKSDNGLLSPGLMPERGPQSPAFSVGSTFLNKMSMSTVPEEDKSDGHSTSSPKSLNDETSPFSDRASVMTDTVAPLNIKHPVRTAPVRYMSGDIRMSFRPISEIDQENSPESRGKSPFGDENKLDRP
ncbi:hypothetical protein H072_1310 [Dactylellina haptotyla CBS 200.50]|uniref:Membrane anchor Opy2 N-terminal domain-containing protein n=1 Tax=Dactylellina haptotyla (strain CBS 200.50) TaxID=1284197 RepID=S8AUR8_DACHA|nr:hypothetical protein H072_1310 [Dactylellina haptotyla CBS 200.50]